MNPIYTPCPCDSGMKFKFCCLKKEPEELLLGAAKFPLFECLIADNEWKEHGLVVLYVCRHVLDFRYISAFYLIDTYCLGLKNTCVSVNLDRDRMLDVRRRIEHTGTLRPFGYEEARSLILGAIEYAGGLGFRPNEDWQYSRCLIEEERPFEPKFKYGKDGRPFYVPGPSDNANSIMKTLANLIPAPSR